MRKYDVYHRKTTRVAKQMLRLLTRGRGAVVSQLSLLHLLSRYLDHVAIATTSASSTKRLGRHCVAGVVYVKLECAELLLVVVETVVPHRQ